jgi:hypothetical protein
VGAPTVGSSFGLTSQGERESVKGAEIGFSLGCTG